MQHGWGGTGLHRVLMEKRERGEYLEYVGVDGRVILKLMFKKWNKECMDWNELVQDRNRWHIIIIFIYCNWVVTRWQWLFYMYTKHEIGYY